LGVGSRFFFTLPLKPATTEVSEISAMERTVTHLAEGYHLQALVVDDIQENRDVLLRILSDIGVQVTNAENGQEALEMVRSHKPDVVFMDIWMPVMDGKEATKQILEEFGDESPKIVAISASALSHEREEYLTAGFHAFIAKPFLKEEIYDCLASLLHVEYEYTDTPIQSAVSPDLSAINIPQNLIRRMETSAELYGTTELKNCLDKLEQLGEDGLSLANYLRVYLQSYDMDAILEVLSRIGEGKKEQERREGPDENE